MRRFEFLSWRTTRSRVLSVAAGALVSIAAASMDSAVQAGVVNLGSFSGEFVTVGDPNNTADTTGYGAVSQTFDIMTFEFTNQQYVQFLNSVDPNGTNPNAIYNANMGGTAVLRGGISFNSGAANGSKYAVKLDMGNKPVNYVSWFDAARVSNWLHNGATSSSSMETGAYDLNNATTGNAVAMIAGARFFIPSENQWYKAAYYDPNKTGGAGYWDYATGSDSIPTTVTANSTGDGSRGSSGGNFANYNSTAVWNGQTGNVTTVGTNGGPSAYGAFDMSGNVREWNDLDRISSSSRGFRGGGWSGDSGLSSSSRTDFHTNGEGGGVGFRVASLSSDAVVPEPSMMVIGMVFGLGGLAAKRRLKK